MADNSIPNPEISHEQEKYLCSECEKYKIAKEMKKARAGRGAPLKEPHICAECFRAAYMRDYREDYVVIRPDGYDEDRKAKSRKKYKEDEEFREYCKNQAKKQRERLGKEVLNKINRDWRRRNPEKQREYHIRHINKMTPEQRLAKGITHRQVYRIQRQSYMAEYNARRVQAPGEISNEHLVSLHKWQDHCCFYCREPLNQRETIEHIVPLSRGGTNHPYNIVLVCSHCNNHKNNKIFYIEWKPDYVATTPRIHSLYQTARLKKILLEQTVPFQDFGDHIQVGERRIYILSSFWLGWQGDANIRAINSANPRALIFYDKEFEAHQEAILNVIRAKAGISNRTGARLLRIEVPSTEEAREFIGRWHALGFTSGTHYLGLRDDQRWWIIAAFRHDVDRYEVVRMACKDVAAGGVSRLIKHFKANYAQMKPLVAFTDQRIGDGASHFPAGFRAEGTTIRTLFYASPVQGGFYARRSYQKGMLPNKVDFFDPALTQDEINQANGMMKLKGLSLHRFILD